MRRAAARPRATCVHVAPRPNTASAFARPNEDDAGSGGSLLHARLAPLSSTTAHRGHDSCSTLGQREGSSTFSSGRCTLKGNQSRLLGTFGPSCVERRIPMRSSRLVVQWVGVTGSSQSHSCGPGSRPSWRDRPRSLGEPANMKANCPDFQGPWTSSWPSRDHGGRFVRILSIRVVPGADQTNGAATATASVVTVPRRPGQGNE